MSEKTDRKSSRVGLYTTLIFHLSVLIILLGFSIGRVASKETSFVLDFTKQEELEKQQKEIELKEDVNKSIDELLSSTPRSRIRNVAVDAGSKLRDDRFKNPSQVYDEAKELQRKLDASKRDALAQKAADEAVEAAARNASDAQEEEAPAYRGPSVISYDLGGRKANYLPVPAYKGYGSGDVLVGITVNQKGRVTDATILSSSTSDPSVNDFVLDAAKRSRFAASNDSQPQSGTILYRFIAQ